MAVAADAPTGWELRERGLVLVRRSTAPEIDLLRVVSQHSLLFRVMSGCPRWRRSAFESGCACILLCLDESWQAGLRLGSSGTEQASVTDTRDSLKGSS